MHVIIYKYYMELDPSIGSIFWVGEMRQSQVMLYNVRSAMALRFFGQVYRNLHCTKQTISNETHKIHCDLTHKTLNAMFKDGFLKKP